MKRKVKFHRLKLVPQDMWVGLYWKYNKLGTIKRLDLYICLIPMVLIHITITQLRLVVSTRQGANANDPNSI